jgi:YjbE family integral membrane protein
MTVDVTALGGQALPWVTSLIGENGVALTQIVAIDILLSGDNAVVIAIACRSLPPRKRFLGIVLGVAVAILLRVLFTFGLTFVLKWPWLMLSGGVLLLLIAIQLLAEADDSGKVIADNKTLAGAIVTIALADLVMSLDNVIAIAGAARGAPWLIFFGLALSIPLIMGGATLLINLLTRFPVLVWAGAALLGWIAGELIGTEPMLMPTYQQAMSALGIAPEQWPHACAAAGALLVIAAGAVAQLRCRRPV